MSLREAAALLHARALCAPHLVDHEIANVAVRKLRRERLPESAVLTSLEAYDAAYLWLAEQLGTPLATFDTRLATAADAHLTS